MGTSNYSNEFKRDAVNQITVRGYPVREASRRLGVSKYSLYKWLKLSGEPSPKLGVNHETENRRLKRELARVEDSEALHLMAVFRTGEQNLRRQAPVLADAPLSGLGGCTAQACGRDYRTQRYRLGCVLQATLGADWEAEGSDGVLHARFPMKFAFIRAHRAEFGVRASGDAGPLDGSRRIPTKARSSQVTNGDPSCSITTWSLA